jgi:hypothetical protein
MPDWIAVGKLDGLFAHKEVAKISEPAREAVVKQAQPEISKEKQSPIKEQWPKMGRGLFIFYSCIVPILWLAGLGSVILFFRGNVDPGILNIGGIALLFVPLLAFIAASLQRFHNLGMHRAWFFGLLVPFLSLWVWYRLFACPPGYAQHKKLDPLGWILAILHWGSLLLLVAAFVFVAHTLTKASKDDPVRAAIEDYIGKMDEARKSL